MQALRHASRRALHATVLQETCVSSVRAYCSEAASHAATRKISKEERYELAKQFIAKFKAGNNGQMPGITLLRKEVGGRYVTVKEILQEFEKGQDELDTGKQTIECKIVEGETQESVSATKDGRKKQSTSKEKDSKTDKKVVPQGLKTAEGMNEADVKTTSKQMEQKDAFKSTMDTALAMDEDGDSSTVAQKFHQMKQSSMSIKDSTRDTALATDEDDDDDSDVAAPEYHHPPLTKMKGVIKAAKGKEKELPTARLKNDAKRPTANQAVKPKHADMKQLKVQDGGNKVELQPKGLGAVNATEETTTKLPLVDVNTRSGGKAFGLLLHTTVVRIVNIPGHISPSKLRSVCESVARVYEVNWRRGRIADVLFNVDPREINDVLGRLRNIPFGSTKLRAFPALKFSRGDIESSQSSQLRPQDANQLKQLRNNLIYSLEQRLKFLCCQVEDFRELQAMKLAK